MSPRLDVSGHAAPKIEVAPKLHDIVTLEQFPAGFPRWRVVAIPPHAAPNDVATLERTDPECPVFRLRRRANTIRLAKE